MIDQVPGSGGNEPDKVNMEDIMNQYQGALLRYATRVLNNEEAAQDVVQEAFIRLHGNWRKVMRRGGARGGPSERNAEHSTLNIQRRSARAWPRPVLGVEC